MTKLHHITLGFAFGIALTSQLYSQEASGITVKVDPAVREKRPSFTVTSPQNGKFNVFFNKINNMTTDFVSSSTIEVTSSTQVEIPVPEHDTYIHATITASEGTTEPLWEWSTLARPAGKKLIDYKGRKEILPQEDFDGYWSKAKKELEKVSLLPEVIRVADRDTSTGLLYRVNLPSVEETTISCWFFVPKKAYENGDPTAKVVEKFPAVIISPGYGAEEPPIDRTADGFVTMSVNPRNHGPSKEFWKAPVEHLIYNIDNPDKYYYKLAFLDCLRASQFVFSRSEVDTAKVAAEGGSQGGILSVGLAMLEPRLKCVVANVIAFSDYPDGINLATKGGMQTMKTYLNNETTKTIVSKTLSYVDGANVVTRLKVPIQINMGGQDPVCSYISGIVLYNRVKEGTPKEYNISPDAKHEVNKEMREWNKAWLNKWLNK